ncbi:MAG: GTPase HflX, partial [Vulcanimicrobiaceae bacterium]
MKALVVAVDLQDRDSPLAPQLEEFIALARAAGAEIAGEIVQKLQRVNAATLFGEGKV